MAEIIHSAPFFVVALSSLFTIINPFSTLFVYLTITQGSTKKKRILIAKKATMTAGAVLLTFVFFGQWILSFFSITIDAFMIAGGILISFIGMEMVHTGKKHFHSAKEKAEAIAKEDVSIIPLAIPMLSGPGAITTTIVLTSQSRGIVDYLALCAAIIIICVGSYFILSRAHLIRSIMGETGRNVVDKIMGIIVLVVGVQFVLNGLNNVVQNWLHP